MPPAGFPPRCPPLSLLRSWGLGLLPASPTFSPVTLSQPPTPTPLPAPESLPAARSSSLLPAGGSQRRLDLVGVGGERQLEESLRAPRLASTYGKERPAAPGRELGAKEHTSPSGRGRGKAAFRPALRRVAGT